jgi:hypothetical protein
VLTSPSTLRRWGLALALATIAIAIIGTQYPFDYRLTGFAVRQRWNRIDWSWFPRTRGGHIRLDHDLVLNLVMLVPLGAGFALWRRAGGWRIVIEGLVLGLVTSVTLELAQLMTRYRYTSFADVWRNAASCAFGCMLAIGVMRLLDARRARSDSEVAPRGD